MIVALKRGIFVDPMLVKLKCVWEFVVSYNFQKFVDIFQLCVYNFSKRLPPLKRILVLQTWSQICNVSVLQSFLSDFFQMEHPVVWRLLSVIVQDCWRKMFAIRTTSLLLDAKKVDVTRVISAVWSCGITGLSLSFVII